MSYRHGPTNTILDVDGLSVGEATDGALKSGVSVVFGDAPMVAAAHVMGGAPGTRETDLLGPDKTVQKVHAIVLSGGSAFGLDAASGVMDALAADGIGFPVGPARVPIVPAAILFDLLNGGDKAWRVNPYRALGAEAYRTRQLTLGSHGAGTGATAGRLKGGLGSASLILPSGHVVGALVACNSLGNTTDAEGRFWAAPFELGDEFGGHGPARAQLAETFETKLSAMERANTTIAIVATDARLTKAEAQRMAVAAHDGMARAIVPSHTPMDGDIVFACATETNPAAHDLPALGHAASLCLARAIARGVHAAVQAPGDRVPSWAAAHGRV